MTTTAALIHALLNQRGATLAVAESLTGGLVAAELTAAPGASRAFRGSVTAYATDVKAAVLGVEPGLLAARGAVDPEVAEQMARGVRSVFNADYGIATTGVAGPDPQDGKPVGTVYVAVADTRRSTAVSPALSGDRAGIRQAAVEAVLDLLHDTLRAESAPPEENGREL